MKKCPVCGKEFSNKVELKQHVQSAHSSVFNAIYARKPNSKRPRNPVARTVARKQNGASRQGSQGVATLAGTDSVFFQSDVSDLASGKIITSIIVEPAIALQLKHVGTIFQRIKYDALEFEIVSKCSMLSTGGYIAAFVRDPADNVFPSKTNDRISYLMAQSGAITVPWARENGSIIRFSSPTWFYTSQSSEIREYSPGKLVIMVDGQSSQKGSLTVRLRWKVSCKDSCVNPPEQPAFVTTADVWSVAGKPNLFADKAGNFPAADAFIAGAKTGDMFRLPFEIAFATGESGFERAWWLYVASAVSVLPQSEDAGTASIGNFKHNNIVIPKGTVLERIRSASGEDLQGLQSVQTASGPSSYRTEPQHCSDALTDFRRSLVAVLNLSPLNLTELRSSCLSDLTRLTRKLQESYPAAVISSLDLENSRSMAFQPSLDQGPSRTPPCNGFVFVEEERS